jgi:hypothetical protein
MSEITAPVTLPVPRTNTQPLVSMRPAFAAAPEKRGRALASGWPLAS